MMHDLDEFDDPSGRMPQAGRRRPMLWSEETIRQVKELFQSLPGQALPTSRVPLAEKLLDDTASQQLETDADLADALALLRRLRCLLGNRFGLARLPGGEATDDANGAAQFLRDAHDKLVSAERHVALAIHCRESARVLYGVATDGGVRPSLPGGPCACLSETSGRPDPDCTICGGSGTVLPF